MPALWRILLAVLLGGTLTGCDALGEPERSFNDAARPPAAAALDVADLRPGQHVAGDLHLALDLDSLAGRVDRVVVRVDGEEVAARAVAPYAFSVPTDRYADGPHDLSVDVHLRDGDLGLLGLAGAPAAVLAVPLVFDQRPPTPVALTSAELGPDLRPRLTWAESADANFHAYLVARYDSWGRGSSALPSAVDTVYGRSATSLLAGPLPDIVGAYSVFEVRVWNRAETSAPSGPVSVGYTTDFVAIDVGGGPAAWRGPEFYGVAGTRLVAASTATHRTVRELPLPGLDGFPGTPPHDVDLDPDGGPLYVASYDVGGAWALQVVDPATFAVERAYRLPAGAEGFAVHGDRLYAAGYPGGGLRLFVLDAGTGAVLAESDGGLLGHSAEAVAVAPDGSSVYVVDWTAGGPAALVRVDVSGEVPRLRERYELGYGPHGSASTVVALPDGRVLVAAGGTVTALDGATLRPLAAFDPGGPTTNVYDLALHVRDGRVVAGYRGNVPAFPSGGEAVWLDPSTLRPVRTWRFAQAPRAVAVAESGLLYAFVPGGAWVAPLRPPTP